MYSQALKFVENDATRLNFRTQQNRIVTDQLKNYDSEFKFTKKRKSTKTNFQRKRTWTKTNLQRKKPK